jgi:signal transduction protein with GAF and PtsI domain
VPLLEVTLSQTNAQGVYLYRFYRDEIAAQLVAWVGRAPGASILRLPLHGETPRQHMERTSPIVLHDAAWSDWRFAGLPEFQMHRFQGVVSIPLRSERSVVGMANVCRSRTAPWKAAEVTFLLSLSLPVAALLLAEESKQGLQKEVERLTQLLAKRKLVERAKGLLQERFECSEEEAYLYLRRASRRRRTPMPDLAQQIIQGTEIDLAEPARHAG